MSDGYRRIYAKAEPPGTYIIGDLKLVGAACPGVKAGDKLRIEIEATVHSVETDKIDVTGHSADKPEIVDGETWITASVLAVDGSAHS